MDEDTRDDVSAPAKAAYEPPRIIAYGTAKELTETAGPSGVADGGVASATYAS